MLDNTVLNGSYYCCFNNEALRFFSLLQTVEVKESASPDVALLGDFSQPLNQSNSVSTLHLTLSVVVGFTPGAVWCSVYTWSCLIL